MSIESATAIQRSQIIFPFDNFDQMDLLDFIDWTRVECLNQSTMHSTNNTLKQGYKGYREDEGLNMESDAGEQLLIYIPSMQVIKLHSIAIKGPEEEGFFSTDVLAMHGLSL
ncbi:hypothetical protein HHK36_028399 [Tetracentron sinense]|uniref:PITH domain-containing protein n=1 Tax=Tetracentron sinense TaxID=13715 RepID=A0A835D3F2_TETSI|nr:hypothetical protein HHK36_028399 [Tetracentron sinense]